MMGHFVLSKCINLTSIMQYVSTKNKNLNNSVLARLLVNIKIALCYLCIITLMYTVIILAMNTFIINGLYVKVENVHIIFKRRY